MTAVVNKNSKVGAALAERVSLPVNNFECSPPCDEASAEIELPTGVTVKLVVSPAGKKPQRLVVAKRGDMFHRDRINTDSSVSRNRFTKTLAEKLSIDVETLAPLIDQKLTELADKADDLTEDSAGQEDGERESQATIAANMAAGWDLWHTSGGVAHATVPVRAHYETWSIKSPTFKRYLAKQFYDKCEKAINSEAVSSSLTLMEAKALFEGEEHDVHVRVAERDGNIYVDLCNEDWQVVEITPSGWNVIDESPVRFRRSRGMLPLPKPEPGGSIEQLRGFLNVDDTAWRLIDAYRDNRATANELALESSPVGPSLIDLLRNDGEWCGSASELLDAVEQRVSDQTKRGKSWPKDGRSMAGHLKRLTPNLRSSGWEIEFQREAAQRTWTIRPMTQTTSPSVTQTGTTASQTEVQTDADQCSSLFHDANDADDATMRIADAGPEQNEDEWEEGEL